MSAVNCGGPLGDLKPVSTSTQVVHWRAQPWFDELRGLPAGRETLQRLENESQPADDGSARLRLVGRGPVLWASDGTAEAVLVAAMVWGFGLVGYGPWRTREMLDSDDAVERLQRLADAAVSDSVSAFAMLSRRSERPRWLGPAFGTKYLHFAARSRGSTSTAGYLPLVLDANVIAGLQSHGQADLSQAAWTVDGYRDYLDVVHRHAQVVGCDPDDVEYALFLAGRYRRRSSSSQRC